MAALKWSAIALAVVGASWLLAREPRGSASAAAAAAAAEGEELAPQDEVAKLQAEVRRLERRVSDQQSLLQAAEAKPDDIAAAPVEPQPLPKPLSSEEAVARLKTHFAATFAGEPHDRQRSDEYLAAMGEIFETERLPPGAIEELDCRQTLCRLTIRHSVDLERDSVSRIFGRGVLRFGSFDFLQDGRTVAYVGAGAPLDTPPPSALPPTVL
jgi:hypothetical protein